MKMITLVLAGAAALGMAVAVAGPATTPQAEGSASATREESARAPSARDASARPRVAPR